MAITKDQIREIVIYAGSVIDVNESAAEDVELLLERVDDEFQIEQMPPDDFKRIERAICKTYDTDGYRITEAGQAAFNAGYDAGL